MRSELESEADINAAGPIPGEQSPAYALKLSVEMNGGEASEPQILDRTRRRRMNLLNAWHSHPQIRSFSFRTAKKTSPGRTRISDSVLPLTPTQSSNRCTVAAQYRRVKASNNRSRNFGKRHVLRQDGPSMMENLDNRRDTPCRHKYTDCFAQRTPTTRSFFTNLPLRPLRQRAESLTL
jgi:hypothetical protein